VVIVSVFCRREAACADGFILVPLYLSLYLKNFSVATIATIAWLLGVVGLTVFYSHVAAVIAIAQWRKFLSNSTPPIGRTSEYQLWALPLIVGLDLDIAESVVVGTVQTAPKKDSFVSADLIALRFVWLKDC
jgi:hypothetical protein